MPVTLKDVNLHDYDSTNLLELRKKLLTAPVEICIERAVRITEYMKNNADVEETPQIFRAEAVAHYLSHKIPRFFDGDENLLAGSTGSKFKSALLFPEFIGLTIWSELDTISKREKNPQLLSAAEAQTLNLDVFPYWLNRDVLSTAKRYIKEKKFSENIGNDKVPLKGNDEIPLKLLERLIFYLSGKGSCISHTVPMFKRVLSEGLNAIIAEAREKAGKKNESEEKNESKDFYTAVYTVLEGFLDYVNNLSKEARRHAEKAEKEGDGKAKKRFMRMAEACENIPAKPASSFYEAVNCIWLCLTAIHAENMNMAISPGRLDQVLYPYYKKDKDYDKLTDKEAADIIGNLFLKLGDNVNLVPAVSEDLFGGAGTAPAVTVGGVDENEKDAVNELTYIMLEVTKILKLREPNVNARYHSKVNSTEYRDTVAKVISETEAIPAFYNDIAIISTLEKQGVSTGDARDYAIIGCVEYSVSGKSYDASSDILLNLAAPLEMALYNGRRFKTGD
ncbi:MAG: pyruvate formate lyase family protein, partial [Chitinispirillales bacterium]|nr:pyruvate formate lyase family protein [Chitinispirillales bacterium]